MAKVNETMPGSNVLSRDTFDKTWKEYLAARAEQNDSGTETARVCKRGKEAGIDIDAMRAVDKVRRMTPERRDDFIGNFACYLDWAGLPKQYRLDLEGATAPPLSEEDKAFEDETREQREAGKSAFEEGKAAGLSGEPMDKERYPKETAGHAMYWHGWKEGQRELVEANIDQAPENTGA